MNQDRFKNVIPGTLVKTYPLFPLLAEPVEGNDRATALYEDAFERDLVLNADCTESELDELIVIYSKLYDLGADCAVSNILRLISIRHMRQRSSDPATFYPRQAQMEYYLTLLEEIDPDLYDYYHAVALLLPIMYVGRTAPESFAEGHKLLRELTEEGNVYAERFGSFLIGITQKGEK